MKISTHQLHKRVAAMIVVVFVANNDVFLVNTSPQR